MTDIIRSIEGCDLLGLGNSNELVMKGTKIVTNLGGSSERTLELTPEGSLSVNGYDLQSMRSLPIGDGNILNILTLTQNGGGAFLGATVRDGWHPSIYEWAHSD